MKPPPMPCDLSAMIGNRSEARDPMFFSQHPDNPIANLLVVVDEESDGIIDGPRRNRCASFTISQGSDDLIEQTLFAAECPKYGLDTGTAVEATFSRVKSAERESNSVRAASSTRWRVAAAFSDRTVME